MANFSAAALTELLASIHIPAPRLTQLRCCAGNQAAAVEQWLGTLPIMQPETCALQIYQVLNEVQVLAVSADDKFAILETLNNTLGQLLPRLAQEYLNKPINLPDSAQKIAALAQAIQKNLSANYWICLKQKIEALDAAPALAKNTSTLVQIGEMARAIFDCVAEQILRHLQLFLPVPKKYWKEAHQLFSVLQAFAPDWQSPRARSCYTRYKQIVLLGASNLNQLRQHEITQCHEALLGLAEGVELVPFDAVSRQHILLIDTQSDAPAIYKAKLSREQARAHLPSLWELNTTAAMTLLRGYERKHHEHAQSVRAGNQDAAELPLALNCVLHLMRAWSHVALRGFDRVKREDSLEIIVGLSDIHFHLAGQTPFSVFARSAEGLTNTQAGVTRFSHALDAHLPPTPSPRTQDAWDGIYQNTSARARPSTQNLEQALQQKLRDEYRQNHPRYRVEIVDSSPSGYGLRWRDPVPQSLRAGELVSLREDAHTQATLGVVRWVHQIKDGATFGVQLIGPLATPVALAAVQKTGSHLEYLRALRLPELRAINQPATLITNAISFHAATKAKLHLGDNSRVSTVLLTKPRLNTSAITQFEFNSITTELAPDRLELL